MICKDIAVMKRKSDSYLNATQILKVAEFDKPQRTRILEREVQTGLHEKVQGGYGKYQGTWVPFERGVALAKQYQVDILLRPIFDYVQGDISPPLAPKHCNSFASRLKKIKTTEPKKKKATKKIKLDQDYASITSLEGEQINELNLTDSEVKNQTNRRKRPVFFDFQEEQRLIFNEDRPTYAQRLLQYFVSDESGIPAILLNPPADLNVNVIIDDEGHTSLHWAAAMGRLKLVKVLVDLGADIYRKTIFNIDKKDQTVFHHVASTASWKGKVHASRYYMECLIETLGQNNISELISILNVQDIYGDTALNIAARIGNKKLVRLLIEAGASAEIANEEGMTAQDYLAETERNNQGGSRSLVESHHTETKQKSSLRHKVEELLKSIIVNEKPPIISHMFDGFASNYERDLIQKDNLIKEKKNELALAKKRLAGTQHTLEQIQFDPERLQGVEIESLRLSKLLAKQIQKLQKDTLEKFFHAQKKDEKIVELDSLLNELKLLQELRKKRVEELIQLKLQMPSKKHQKYKRLISMCCNVSYENVDLMLLPLLSSFDELLLNKE
ncbi:hypothetical protein RO3G_11837 [Rhizopus delemar RA 99-880]|uniref:HTH APSES-type domain-containing protein n=1 Tax=Rhizopus delemar (strain RA 99-880 / ATCC MYA-4621 / FGSC 9543 / NRRL 43880) TaxID=246409 RepID=I1CF96_RHIO9|nr:hypothetical protein RO3G_11837 [Rhizopus delemar RA 99-880]|eukprot:EIE87126.1 hypothetical protein RO3G_11837 [Rhizopus delemar RA 99-880]